MPAATASRSSRACTGSSPVTTQQATTTGARSSRPVSLAIPSAGRSPRRRAAGAQVRLAHLAPGPAGEHDEPPRAREVVVGRPDGRADRLLHQLAGHRVGADPGRAAARADRVDHEVAPVAHP